MGIDKKRLRESRDLIQRDDIATIESLRADGWTPEAFSREYLVAPWMVAAGHGSIGWLRDFLSRDEIPSGGLAEALVEAIAENERECALLLLEHGAEVAGPAWELERDELAPITAAFMICDPVIVEALCDRGAILQSDAGWIEDALRLGLKSRKADRARCLSVLAKPLTSRLREGPPLKLDHGLLKKLVQVSKKQPDLKRNVEIALEELAGIVDTERALTDELFEILMESEDAQDIRKISAILGEQEPGLRRRVASELVPHVTDAIGAPDLECETLLDDLIQWGADVSTPSDAGMTALMISARRGQADLVRRLVSLGAEVNAIDEEGRTALDFLMSRSKPNREVYRFLVSVGAQRHSS